MPRCHYCGLPCGDDIFIELPENEGTAYFCSHWCKHETKFDENGFPIEEEK